MKDLIPLLLTLILSQTSNGQNYSKALGEIGYLKCDQLEETIVKKAKLTKGYDDYELNSSFLEKIKFYWEESSNYWFVIVKFKENESNYVYCGLKVVDVGVAQLFIENKVKSTGELFNEYINPYKCDCK